MRQRAEHCKKAGTNVRKGMIFLSLCLGFALCQCRLLGLTLPFGMALVCACPLYLVLPGSFGCLLGLLWTDLAGSKLYYLCFLGLCVLARLAFCRTKPGRSYPFSLLCSLLSAGGAFWIEWLAGQGTVILTFLQGCELALILAFGYFCRQASRLQWQEGRLVWNDRRQAMGAVFLAALLLLSTLSFTIYQACPGRILAIVVLICVMERLGVQGASVCAISLSLLFCCYSTELLDSSLILTCAAFFGGLFRFAGKGIQLAGFFFVCAVLTAIVSPDLAGLTFLGEAALGVGFSLLVPKRWLHALALSQKQPETKPVNQAVSFRLSLAGEALQAQCRSLYRRQERRQPPAEENFNDLAAQVRREICEDCPRFPRCAALPSPQRIKAWKTPLFLQKDSLPPLDCLHREALFCYVRAGLNERVFARKLFHARQSFLLLGVRQMDSLGEVLKDMARQTDGELSARPQTERQIAALLGEMDLSPLQVVVLEKDALWRAQLYFPREAVLSPARIAARLSAGLERKLVCADPVLCAEGQMLCLRSPCGYRAKCEFYQISRFEKAPCGDDFVFLEDFRGWQFFFLADGMGTGAPAARDSRALSRLAKALLLGGYSPSAVLRLCGASMEVSPEAEGCCAVDLLCVNPYERKARFYKIGGAPSVLAEVDKLRWIQNHQLPLGILDSRGYQGEEYALPPKGRIYLWSDGMSLPPEILEKLLPKYSDLPPQTAARRLCELAAQYRPSGEKDDVTVAVVELGESEGTQNA